MRTGESPYPGAEARRSLDFRSYAAASSQASRMAWSSSHVGWSGRGALNLAAMRTRRSRAVMSLVDGSALLVYQGEFLRRACRSSLARPAVAYQVTVTAWQAISN